EWSLLESFVLVADAGGFTAAAQHSGKSQPTLSRHVQQLEAQLGVTLFDRHARGLELTERGTALYGRAQRVGSAVDDFLREATGLSESLRGTVRITLSEVMGTLVMPPWAAAFRKEAPHIELDWVVDNAASNLLTREAEVAVRMFPSEQLDLVTRHVGSFPLGFFGSVEYFERKGEPEDPTTLLDHDLVGYDRATTFIDHAARMGYRYERSHFVFRSDSMLAQIEAVRAGVGIAVMQVDIGRRFPELRQVLPQIPLPSLGTWVVAHPDVKRNPLVRRVFDSLARYLSIEAARVEASLTEAAQPGAIG